MFFSGVVTTTTAPGVNVGDSFSGEFTYSTDDTFEVTLGDQSEYSFLGGENSESVSSGAFNFSLDPPSGVIDNLFVDPVDGCFVNQEFAPPGTPGISLQFCGNANFLTSSALPDPFNAGDLILGNVAFPSSNIGFTDGTYLVDGYLTQASVVPEPRGLVFVFGFVVALALCGRLMTCRS